MICLTPKKEWTFYPTFTYLLLLSIGLIFFSPNGFAQITDTCGFEKNYPTISITDASLVNVAEASDGFSLSFEGNSPTALTSQTISISSVGELTNNDVSETPIDTFINRVPIDDNAFIVATGARDENPARAVFLSKVNFQGTSVWERQYDLTPINEIFSISASTVFVTEDAYFIVGRYVDADATFNPTFFFFSIKTDKEGNLIFLNTYEVDDFFSPQVYDVDGNDNVYAGYQTSGRTGHIIKLAGNGNLEWDQSILGDLVSNRISKVQLSNDETQLIVSGFSDPKAFVRRLDLTTGEAISNILPSNFFTPDDFTVSERGIQLLETQDGGTIISYPFFSTNGLGTGIEYGKLDKEGNAIWSKRLRAKPFDNITPIFENTDGSILFQTVNSDNEFVLLKTTPTGSLLPTCGQPVPQCTADIITFNSQAEVDAFNPCEIFDGAIAIAGADITNVDALKGLTTITGGFFIRSSATSLTSLEGLRDLTTIGKGIEIISAPTGQLTSLEGLNNVTHVGNRIFIQGTKITNTFGLGGVMEVVGDTFLIGENPTFITGSIQFVDNDQLEEIILRNLAQVEGEITIAGNDRLKTINLFTLTSISESLTIASNDSLSNIDGLRNLESIGETSTTQNILSLSNNPLLGNCCEIVDLVSRLDSTKVSIQDNGMTCSSINAVNNNCLETSCDMDVTLSSQLRVNSFGPCEVLNGSLVIAGEDITDLSSLRGLQEITGNVFIDIGNLPNLETLEGFNDLTTIGGSLNIRNNGENEFEDNNLSNLDAFNRLTSVGRLTLFNTTFEQIDGLGNLEEVNGKVEITSNERLNSIGLSSLKRISDLFRISNNNQITDLTALSNLETIGGPLSILSNDELLSTTGLENVSIIASEQRFQSITISGNPKLSDCCSINELISNQETPISPIRIENNALGCDSLQELAVRCSTMPTCPLTFSTIELPDSVKTGDLIKIVATVRNTGFATAGSTNVGLYSFFGGSRQPGPLPVLIKEFPIENLAVGEERTFTFEEVLSFRRNPENVSAGRYALLFRPDSVTTNLFPLRECETNLDFNVKPQLADVAISLDGSDCIDSNGELQADLVLTNTGTDTIQGPLTLQFSSPPSPTAIIAEDEVVRTIFGTTFRTRRGPLAPGESISFSRPFSFPSSDTIDINYRLNIASLDIRDTNPANNSVSQQFIKRQDCSATTTTCDLLNNATFDPCNPLVREIAVYEFEGETFLVSFPDMSMIADLPTRVVSCKTGVQFCLLGFVADPTPCQAFFESAVKIETIIDKEKDCQDCICPDVNEPVCGSDGVTYANSCEAECAGVEWEEGKCMEEESFIDLELNLTTTNTNPSIYTRLPLTTTISNKGSEMAEDISIRLIVCNSASPGFQQVSGIVYANTAFDASTGTYDVLNQVWTIPSLAPNETATLNINLFTITEDPIAITAHVETASPMDIDSSPGFTSEIDGCFTVEDDEDDLALNGISLCDCPDELDPVCGSDGIIYDNACEAECVGVTYEVGECESLKGETTCGEITVTYGNGKIDIVGQRGKEYFFKVHRRQPIWEYVFECNGKCGFGQTVSGLPSGTYYVDVYDKSWHLICDDIEVVLNNGKLSASDERSLPSWSYSNESSKVHSDNILVFPNPASEIIHIESHGEILSNRQIIITDNLGRKVKVINWKDESISLPVSNFQNGIYQITVISDGVIKGQKRVVVVR